MQEITTIPQLKSYLDTNFPTKQFLFDNFVTRVEFNGFRKEMREFRREVNEKFDRIFNLLDGLVGRVHNHDQEITVLNHRVDVLEDKAS